VAVPPKSKMWTVQVQSWRRVERSRTKQFQEFARRAHGQIGESPALFLPSFDEMRCANWLFSMSPFKSCALRSPPLRGAVPRHKKSCSTPGKGAGTLCQIIPIECVLLQDGNTQNRQQNSGDLAGTHSTFVSRCIATKCRLNIGRRY